MNSEHASHRRVGAANGVHGDTYRQEFHAIERQNLHLTSSGLIRIHGAARDWEMKRAPYVSETLRREF
jgi:hypothetical protein